tara:strand:+ start:3519 stop:3878 length:360 start_codon:yes stop_codon:yes gene_type:complete
MNKDEEIKHLTDLSTRTIDRNGRLNRELKSVQTLLEIASETNTDLSRQLKATREKWNEDKAALSACRNAVKVGATQRARVDNQNLELQNLLYATISMLSEQDADDVLSQLDKIQQRTEI